MTYPMDQRLLKLKKKMKMYRSQTVHFWNKRKKIVRYYKIVCVEIVDKHPIINIFQNGLFIPSHIEMRAIMVMIIW
jgi:hypothetical protein